MPSSAVYFRLQKRKDTLVHRPIAGPWEHEGFKVFVIGTHAPIWLTTQLNLILKSARLVEAAENDFKFQ